MVGLDIKDPLWALKDALDTRPRCLRGQLLCELGRGLWPNNEFREKDPRVRISSKRVQRNHLEMVG